MTSELTANSKKMLPEPNAENRCFLSFRPETWHRFDQISRAIQATQEIFQFTHIVLELVKVLRVPVVSGKRWSCLLVTGSCWCFWWVGDIWVFPKIGVPQNGWFIMENPIFGNTHLMIFALDETGKERIDKGWHKGRSQKKWRWQFFCPKKPF